MYASLITKKNKHPFAHLQRPYDVRRMPAHFPPGGGFIAVIITDFLRNVNKRAANPNRIDRPARTPPPRVFPAQPACRGIRRRQPRAGAGAVCRRARGNSNCARAKNSPCSPPSGEHGQKTAARTARRRTGANAPAAGQWTGDGQPHGSSPPPRSALFVPNSHRNCPARGQKGPAQGPVRL